MSLHDDNFDQIAEAVRDVLVRGGGIVPGVSPGMFPQPIFPLATAGVAGLFPVNLDQVAGSAGSLYDECTFAYNLFGLADSSFGNPLNQILTSTGSYTSAIQPLCSRARVFNARVTEADFGTAYYDPDGDIFLWDCDESIDTLVVPMVTTPSKGSGVINIIPALVFDVDASTSSVADTSTWVFPDTSFGASGIDSNGCIHVLTKSVTFLGVVDG